MMARYAAMSNAAGCVVFQVVIKTGFTLDEDADDDD